jgi:non-ribosomal peptide synthase protein (TIGR01720 family)
MIEVDGAVSGGTLQLEWTYGTGLHKEETIAKLSRAFIDRLGELIDHCLSPEAGEFTASDVEQYGWTGEDLEDIISEIEKSTR